MAALRFDSECQILSPPLAPTLRPQMARQFGTLSGEERPGLDRMVRVLFTKLTSNPGNTTLVSLGPLSRILVRHPAGVLVLIKKQTALLLHERN